MDSLKLNPLFDPIPFLLVFLFLVSIKGGHTRHFWRHAVSSYATLVNCHGTRISACLRHHISTQFRQRQTVLRRDKGTAGRFPGE